MFVGAIALIGAMVLSFERGVELLNFGALLAFMGVNIAALARFYFREPCKRWFNFASPVLGFLICMLLWLSLSWRAQLLGVAWMAIGLAYGAYHTRGFRRELVSFEIPDADGRSEKMVPDATSSVSR